MHEHTHDGGIAAEVKTESGWRRLEVPKEDAALLSIAGSVLKGLEGRKRLRAYRHEKIDIIWAKPEEGEHLYAFDVTDKDGNTFSVTVTRSEPNHAAS